MAVTEIPIAAGILDQTLAVPLGLAGESFTLRVRWNARSEQWLLDVSDGTGQIVTGRPLTIGNMPLMQFVSARMPHGQFIVLDSTGQDLEAGQADMGARVQLLFIDAA